MIELHRAPNRQVLPLAGSLATITAASGGDRPIESHSASRTSRRPTPSQQKICRSVPARHRAERRALRSDLRPTAERARNSRQMADFAPQSSMEVIVPDLPSPASTRNARWSGSIEIAMETT